MSKATEPVKAPDLVTVTLPRATGKEEDTVFVALNGKGYTIRRGVPVRVPRAIYNILAESRRQQERQAAYEEKMQRLAEKNASLYGL